MKVGINGVGAVWMRPVAVLPFGARKAASES
jgi:hypothetical protein